MFFRRGMIERCLSREEAARAWFGQTLATNPYFSLRWSFAAQRYAT